MYDDRALAHGFSPSVTIHEFDVTRVAILEAKTHSPLIVDANAPLARTVASETLQAVGGRHSQVIDAGDRIQLDESHDRASADLEGNAAGFARRVKVLGSRVRERPDHVRLINVLFTLIE
ncbi:MAG: hypothetical protein WB493_12075 [Anaeromyxobacteraceae bacterium]